MRNLVCASLPLWPTQRLRLSGAAPEAGRPLALVEGGPKGLRVTALDAAARAAGLEPGMSLASARAVAGDLAVRPRDRAAEAAALDRLARWCGRWSPVHAALPAHADLPDCILLDATGADHLCGGPSGLVADMRVKLSALGLQVRVASAPTAGAAMALAACAPEAEAGLVAPTDPVGLRAAVDALPVAALSLDPDMAAALRELGFARVGDLARQPAAGLARRFGPALTRALDRARGLEHVPAPALAPLPCREVRLRPVEPILLRGGLEKAAGRVAGLLCDRLDRDCEGARRVRLRLWRVDGAILDVAAGSSRAHRDAVLWARTLCDRIAAMAEGPGLDIGFGVDLVALAAVSVERLAGAQAPLDPDAAAGMERADALHRLADRLSARMGAGRVVRWEAVADWRPERAFRTVAAVTAADGGPDAAGAAAMFPADLAARRPLVLAEPPEPVEAVAEMPDGPPRLFRWRGTAFRTARADGPERIACGGGPARDYYRVETHEGLRVWLCRRDRPDGAAPSWFVHGHAV